MQESETRLIFEKYKGLYPLSIATFSEDENKIAFWKWAIKQAERRPIFESIVHEEPKEAESIRLSRAVKSWDNMPNYIKYVYRIIADSFAGYQIAAVGSQIDGTSSMDVNLFREFRQSWGKNPDKVSDYDFIIMDKINPLDAEKYTIEAQGRLSTGGFQMYKIDLLKNYINEQKILIPMWDFDKLTDEQRKQARALFNAQKWGALMKLHNDLKLSENEYCCNEAPIIKWFTWAANNGKI